jgi:hypothetical protein
VRTRVSGLRTARALYCSVAVSLFVLAVFCPSSARGDWSGDVQIEPSQAYQYVSFDLEVTVTNTGDQVMRVSHVGAVIDWPGDLPFPDVPSPSESFEVFSGNESIAPGESRTFSRSSSSSFFGGGFPLTVRVTAVSEGDAAPVTKEYSSNITFAPASQAPHANDDVIFYFALVFFILVLGVVASGFYSRKKLYDAEIKNALKLDRPDGKMLWKWFPYYWEKQGRMWLNYALWFAVAMFLTSWLVLALSR